MFLKMACKDWRSGLNQSGLLSLLSQNGQDVRELVERKRCSNILGVHQQFLLVWHHKERSILATNLNSFQRPSDDDADNFQSLLLTNPPVTPVHSLLVSPTAQLVALVGHNNLTIVHLPRTWTRGSNTKEKIICRSVPVDERHLSSTCGQVSILQTRWFPATNVYLAVLTSENQLKIYNALNPEEAQLSLTLGANSTLLRCLGDTAVSFDFMTRDPSQWTVVILRGNGDVLTLTLDGSVLEGDDENDHVEFASSSSTLCGPLTMHPPAEDNYGVDACAILCLPTTPPLLVIATASGTLYHCVVLRRTEQDDSELALYVVDSVELELSLTTRCVQTGDLEEDLFTCPIHLMSDASNPTRYHCGHVAGVHTVVVPFLCRLEEFVLSDSMSTLALDDQECVVEHVVCTKPLNNSPLAPVLGLTVVGGTHSCLICLTADYEFVVVNLACLPRDCAPVLLTDSVPGSLSASPSSSDAFEVHVRSLLRRAVSHPILKSSAEAELAPQESLQLLLRATQVLRWEYIHRLEVVHDEIHSRVAHLRRVKGDQESQVTSLQQRRSSMRQNAEILAERYEDACDKQSQLVARVENVLRSIQRSLPVMSDAEHAMLKELRMLGPSVAALESSLEQIKVKRKFQERHNEGRNMRGIGGGPWVSPGTLSDVRKQQLHSILKKQGSRLVELKTTLARIKQELGV